MITLDSLPQHIVIQIVDECDRKSMLQLAATNKSLRACVMKSEDWRLFFCLKFPRQYKGIYENLPDKFNFFRLYVMEMSAKSWEEQRASRALMRLEFKDITTKAMMLMCANLLPYPVGPNLAWTVGVCACKTAIFIKNLPWLESPCSQ